MTSTANTPSGESYEHGHKNMCRLSKDKQESLEKLFRVAYHIVLRGHPYTDFVNELEVQILHKVEFFKGVSCENESAC